MSDRESSGDRGGTSPPEEPSSMEEGRRSPTEPLDDHEAASETVQPDPVPLQARTVLPDERRGEFSRGPVPRQARTRLPDERRGEFSRGERRDKTVAEDSREEHSRAEATSVEQRGATAREKRTSDVVESRGVVKRRRVNPEDLESSRSTLDIEARVTEPDNEGFLDSSQLPLAVQQLSSASHETMGPGVHHMVLENQAVPDLLEENRRLEASGETTQQADDLSVREEAMSRVSGPSGSGRSADPQTPHSVSDGSGRRDTRTQVPGTQPADAGSRTETWASNPRARFADGGPAADQHQWRVPRAPGGTSLSSRSGRSADPDAPLSADGQSVTSRSTVPSLRGRAEELSVREPATAEMDPGSVSGRSADSSGLHAPVNAEGSTEPGSLGNEPPQPGEPARDQAALDSLREDEDEEGSAGSLVTQSELPDIESLEQVEDQAVPRDADQTVGGGAPGQIYAPSFSARSADRSGPRSVATSSHPARSADAGSVQRGAEPGGQDAETTPAAIRQTPFDEELDIIDLAHHRQTDQIFILVRSPSGVVLQRLRRLNDSGAAPVKYKIDLTISVSSMNEDTSNIGNVPSITVVNDFVIVRVRKRLSVFHIEHFEVRRRIELPEYTLDIAGPGLESSIYCLLSTGEVVVYSVPGLELVGPTITLPGQEQGEEYRSIATCPTTTRTAIMSVNSGESRARVYDRDWTCISDVRFQGPELSGFCLCADDLIMTSEGGDLYHITYTRATALRTMFRDEIFGPEMTEITALCPAHEDRVLLAVPDGFGLFQICQLDLRDLRVDSDARESRSNTECCTRTDTGILVRLEDVPHIEIESSILFIHSVYSESIGINKHTGELLKMSRSGHVTVYGRDVTRPLDEGYQLPLPAGVKVRRFDTTDEGEVVVVSEDDQVMVFSPDRRLAWSTRLGQDARDVVCSGERIYVLSDDQIIIFIRDQDRTEESRRLPLGLQDHHPQYTRLAVHGDVVYLTGLSVHRVLRMDLSDPAPSCTTLIQDEYLYPTCLAVTDDGEVVVGGGWRDESGAWQHGILVYSPTGEERRRVALTDDRVMELALRPGDGIYILMINSNLQFIENF